MTSIKNPTEIAREWIRTDPQSCAQDVQRLGLDDAIAYQMRLIADRSAAGDTTWDGTTEEDMRVALTELTGTRYQYQDVEPAQISAIDLREEVKASATPAECAHAWRVDDDGSRTDAESIQVVYFPASGRAGLAHGADATWTDAESIEDAIERFLGVGGKQIQN